MKLDTYIPCSKRKSGIAFLGHWVKIKAVEKHACSVTSVKYIDLKLGRWYIVYSLHKEFRIAYSVYQAKVPVAIN